MKRVKLCPYSYVIFDTEFGPASLIWTENGLSNVLFPRASRSTLTRELKSRFPEALSEAHPPAWVGKIVSHLCDLLSGGRGKIADWGKMPIDLSAVPGFHAKVYREALRIPHGQTLSYQSLAERAGSPKAARAVGQAMARNPMPLVVPCHRVMAANGKIGGFTAPGGLSSKQRLLKLEGIECAVD